jgi:hypothetical protein
MSQSYDAPGGFSEQLSSADPSDWPVCRMGVCGRVIFLPARSVWDCWRSCASGWSEQAVIFPTYRRALMLTPLQEVRWSFWGRTRTTVAGKPKDSFGHAGHTRYHRLCAISSRSCSSVILVIRRQLPRPGSLVRWLRCVATQHPSDGRR